MMAGLSTSRCGWIALATMACGIAAIATALPASAQLDPRRGPPGCVPASERQMERGCYILVSHPLGELPSWALFWHIDAYPGRAAAEAAKRPRGTVVEALGRTWLMSIAEAGYRPPGGGGERVAEVGPLTTKAGTAYTAAYMEGIMLPGAVTGVHRHPGPEAIHTLAGEECMETPGGGSSAARAARRSSSRPTCRTGSPSPGRGSAARSRSCCTTPRSPGRSGRTNTAGRRRACAGPSR